MSHGGSNDSLFGRGRPAKKRRPTRVPSQEELDRMLAPFAAQVQRSLKQAFIARSRGRAA